MAPQLQYSCLENPMDGGAWRATVYWVTRVGHELVTKQETKIYSEKLFLPFEGKSVHRQLLAKSPFHKESMIKD